MTDNELIAMLDPIVWAAHFACKFYPDGDFYFALAIDPADWRRYWAINRRKARGNWHGATGEIAERLGHFDTGEWMRMVRFQMPEKPKCLGDSSHCYTGYIKRGTTLLSPSPTPNRKTVQ